MCQGLCLNTAESEMNMTLKEFEKNCKERQIINVVTEENVLEDEKITDTWNLNWIAREEGTMNERKRHLEEENGSFQKLKCGEYD